MLNSCHDPHYDRHYPRFSPSNLGRSFLWFCVCVGFRLRRTPPKYFSDLRWGLAANVITATFKFGDRLAPEFLQSFLARSHDGSE
jgi:hypothetical protein